MTLQPSIYAARHACINCRQVAQPGKWAWRSNVPMLRRSAGRRQFHFETARIIFPRVAEKTCYCVVRQLSVHCLFLQQTNSAETECLKINCSWFFVSSAMEYLSKERTFPETFAPLSRWTVICLPAACATFKNDSWTLITDMIQLGWDIVRKPSPLAGLTEDVKLMMWK